MVLRWAAKDKEMKMSEYALILLVGLLVVFLQAFSQTEPSNGPKPLTTEQKLVAAQSQVMMKDSQRALLSSPAYLVMTRMQQNYQEVLSRFQELSGADPRCILTNEQEWLCPIPAAPIPASPPKSVPETPANETSPAPK